MHCRCPRVDSDGVRSTLVKAKIVLKARNLWTGTQPTGSHAGDDFLYFGVIDVWRSKDQELVPGVPFGFPQNRSPLDFFKESLRITPVKNERLLCC
jgi:hypothetical protein